MPDIQEILGVREITQHGVWKALLAEFIGTLLLNYLGCSSATSGVSPGDTPSLVLISLAFGLVVFAMVQTFGHVSGCHINPAVTMGMLVTGNITVIKAIFYIIAQCAGAVSGSGILKALSPNITSLGMTMVSDKITPVQGFGVEFMVGFTLLLVIFGVCDSNRNDVKRAAPLAIGLTVALCHLAVINYTGASMNSARTFGSAVITGVWENHWVYWLGPCLGGIAASLLYKHVFSAPPANKAPYLAVKTDEKEDISLNGSTKFSLEKMKDRKLEVSLNGDKDPFHQDKNLLQQLDGHKKGDEAA